MPYILLGYNAMRQVFVSLRTRPLCRTFTLSLDVSNLMKYAGAFVRTKALVFDVVRKLFSQFYEQIFVRSLSGHELCTNTWYACHKHTFYKNMLLYPNR